MADAERAERERRFWDRYIKILHKQGITPPFDRWHVIRAEQFLKAFPDRKLADQTPDSVHAYLEDCGRQAGLQGWQFRQIVVATRILFSMVAPESMRGFDWDFWLDSSKSLEPGHPTIARAPVSEDDSSEPMARIAEKLDERGCARMVHQYPDAFSGLVNLVRTRGMSIRTEKTYLHWLCRFLSHYPGCIPAEMGAHEVIGFLQHLAVERNVSASTQNQALNALVFFFDKVSGRPLGDLGPFVRAKRPKRLPVVLSTDEVRRLMAGMEGVQGLIARLLYGTGMRLLECLRLRVQDIEFERRTIVVRRGKGDKDRVVPLPDSLIGPLHDHLEKVRHLHQADVTQ